MRTPYLFASLTLGVVLAHGAGAATVLSDDFSADTPGLALTSLPNFTVSGTVDVVAPVNPYGIVTPKNVVDLDGTPGPGKLTTGSFGYAANQLVTLTFVLGGAQRGSIDDPFQAGFTFAGTTTINHYTLGGGYGSVDIGSFTTPDIETYTSIAGSKPFTTYSLSFVTSAAGSLTANIGTSSADNVGPLLSSVKLDIGAVPEPASWALMVAGFGLVGVASRRRRFAIA